jgi:hypothetical protein
MFLFAIGLCAEAFSVIKAKCCGCSTCLHHARVCRVNKHRTEWYRLVLECRKLFFSLFASSGRSAKCLERQRNNEKSEICQHKGFEPRTIRFFCDTAPEPWSMSKSRRKKSFLRASSARQAQLASRQLLLCLVSAMKNGIEIHVNDESLGYVMRCDVDCHVWCRPKKLSGICIKRCGMKVLSTSVREV